MKKVKKYKNSYKVFFIYKDNNEQLAEESIWADKEGDFYRVKNIPFFTNNIAYNDLISVEIDDVLYFDSLIEESGHSTVQLVFFDMEYFDHLTNTIIEMGCSWEGSHLKEYISIDVPKNCDFKKVKLFLELGLSDGKWDYKEACISEFHRNTLS